MKVYTVYDAISESFSPPMINRTRGEAIRSFTDEVNNPQSRLNAHAKDYTLFEIADWDETTATIEPFQAPFPVITALEAKQVEEKPLTEKAA